MSFNHTDFCINLLRNSIRRNDGKNKIGVQNSFTTVIMGWNCDDKVLYNSLAPRDSPSVPYQSASCSSKTDYTVNINTNMWELSFEDNKCCRRFGLT